MRYIVLNGTYMLAKGRTNSTVIDECGNAVRVPLHIAEVAVAVIRDLDACAKGGFRTRGK